MGIYQDLGLTPVINASGKMTALGGSVLSDATAQAMAEAGQQHVVVDDLLRAAGRVIAHATGTEDGCPSTGAAAGIAISVAALLAGTDPARVEALPDSGDRPNEVILPKGHAVNFGAPIRQMIALGGGSPVEVGAANRVDGRHLASAIGAGTAALLYVQSHHAVQKGMVSLEETVRIGHAHRIPVIVDAAAEEDLARWPATGADLVVFSGGKAVGGPASGLICGRKDLIAACRAQYAGIARAMKVGKETVLGLVRALEEYGTASPDDGRERMARLAGRLAPLPGLSATVLPDDAGRSIFRTVLTVDPAAAGRDAATLATELTHGSPAIFLRDHHANTGQLAIDPRPIAAADEDLIVARLTELLDGEVAS